MTPRLVPPVGYLDAACRDRDRTNHEHVAAVLRARRDRETCGGGPAFTPDWETPPPKARPSEADDPGGMLFALTLFAVVALVFGALYVGLPRLGEHLVTRPAAIERVAP